MKVIDIRKLARSTEVNIASMVTVVDLLLESVTVYVFPRVTPDIVAIPADDAVAVFVFVPSVAVTVAFAVVVTCKTAFAPPAEAFVIPIAMFILSL